MGSSMGKGRIKSQGREILEEKQSRELEKVPYMMKGMVYQA